MAHMISDRRDVDFVLHELLEIDKLSENEVFAEFNKKTIDLVVTEARNLAIKELLPAQPLGDREGCRFENGEVKAPESFRRLYELFKEGEWVAMAEDPKWGGQGMPKVLAIAASEFFVGANCAFMMYPGLTHGAGKLVEAFGTDRQKKLFLRKLYSGEWTGTMLLTEPEAGSDVGALTTTAVKNGDGTYNLTGNKIFISGGEHDLAENIIHPVLARIEGAPAGTKGISLFLVPKIWVADDGSLGERNDIVCTGIEEKMGIHGNSTCSLALGSKGQCRGMLLGQENKGMREMFLMMNEARLLVGLQGLGFATCAYTHAVNYAKERVQGKEILKVHDPEAPGVPIIRHPDVRRQLLTMKAYVEGMRSLLYFTYYCIDKVRVAESPEEKAKYHGFVDFLTPIVKGYVTDRAFEVCSQGLQVFGGYGYIKDYPMEQLLRDCRITMIYEGTNGVQAMDLIGRKLPMNEGKTVMELMGAMQETLSMASEMGPLKDLASKFEQAVEKLSDVGMHLFKVTGSGKIPEAFAFAHPFMDVAGDVSLGWIHLWRASTACKALEKGAKKKDKAYYEGVVKSAEFFIRTVLPVAKGKMDAILDGCDAAVSIEEESFAGK